MNPIDAMALIQRARVNCCSFAIGIPVSLPTSNLFIPIFLLPFLDVSLQFKNNRIDDPFSFPMDGEKGVLLAAMAISFRKYGRLLAIAPDGRGPKKGASSFGS